MRITLAFAELENFLTRRNRVRRKLRKVFHHIKDGLDKIEEKLKGEMKEAAKRGDVDLVMKYCEEEETIIQDEGEEKLITEEITLEVVMRRFEMLLKHLPEMVAEIRPAVMSSGLTQEEKNEVLKTVNAIKPKLKRIFQKMLDTVQADYQALFEQLSGVKEDRTKEDHWFQVRAEGLLRLTRAMRNIYHIPGDQRLVEADMKHIEEAEHHLHVALHHTHKDARAAVSEWQNIQKDEKRMVESINTLANHFETVMDRFTQIFRVFVMYLFILQAEKKDMQGFFTLLEGQGFPEKKLEILKEKYAKAESKIIEDAKKAVRVAQSERDVPQELLRKAA